MRRNVLLVMTLCAFAVPALAQLEAPNSSGVAMGHVHLVGDVEAQMKFLTLLGGVPMKSGALDIVQFPGAFVNLRQGEVRDGSAGSTVDHFGFNVKAMSEWMPKWKAAGITIEPMNRPTQAYLIGPGGVRVEIIEDTALETPVKFHHIHFFSQDPLSLQAFYVKTFGAVPANRGNFVTADLPGVNLRFSQSEGPTAMTQGRVLDHIGFEIRNLEAFTRSLQASGLKLDREYQTSSASPTLKISYLADPAGTYIEMTEGLMPQP